MPQNITVVIIDSDVESLGKMTNYLKNLAGNVSVEGAAASFESGYELIHKKKPAVVIIEVGPDVELAIERISRLLDRFPRMSIFATSSDKSSDTILKVMRAGEG